MLELGEEHLDVVQIGRVFGQEEELCADQLAAATELAGGRHLRLVGMRPRQSVCSRPDRRGRAMQMTPLRLPAHLEGLQHLRLKCRSKTPGGGELSRGALPSLATSN